MKPDYCTQNDGKCKTCSLVNYGMDCQNNYIHGGYRPGAGRKPTGRKRKFIYLTDDEYEKVKELLDTLRNPD